MKKTFTLIVAIAAMALASFTSCDSKFDRLLNPEWVKNISLVDANGNVTKTLSEKDALAIADCIAWLEFDAAFNASAEAVRMVSPDYSLLITYKAEGDTDETVKIWASGRTLLREQWYNLRAKDVAKVMAILKKY